MANQEDIERAKLGKEAWNAWAEENPGAKVDFSGNELNRKAHGDRGSATGLSEIY